MAVASLNGKPPARLEHRSQGRVRVRLPKSERSPRVMEDIRQRLGEHPGVRHVEVNSATGSVLVTGENAGHLQSALGEVLTLIESFEEERAREAGVEATVELVRRADERLRTVTRGRFSLRVLVPTVFVSVGIRQLLRQGLSVGTIPWYVLIYYGIDSFFKLYPQYAPQRDDAVRTA